MSETTENTENVGIRKYTEILDKFKSTVANSSQEVFDGVVGKFVAEEKGNRENVIVKAIQEVQKLEKDLKKIKPDNENFDEDGKPEKATYSKAKHEERQKIKKRITDLDAAINMAFDKSDFSKIKNLVK